jgi:hypothetical protein
VEVFVTASVALLAVGAGLWVSDWKAAAEALWATATLLGLGQAIGLIVGALRRREPASMSSWCSLWAVRWRFGRRLPAQ